MKKRIVITGIGLVTPLGIGIEENWASLMAGKSGIDMITKFDVTDAPVKIAGEVHNFEPTDYVDKKDTRRYDVFIIFALAAAELAMQQAKLEPGSFNPERAGVIIGSGIGGFKPIEDTQTKFLEGGYRKVSPFFIPSSIINMSSGALSIRYGFKGPNLSVVSACSSGTHAIGDAMKIIQRGDADVMLCGGAESAITPLAIGGFGNMKALSTRNDDPKTASRPFEKNREGFVMGEGSGVFLIESLEHAQARGANILAEIVGYGLTGDAYHMTAPEESGDGGRRTMEMAMRDAGITPDQVQYINAHGTSTPYNDVIETRAVKLAFGDHAKKLKISSTKSMTGHLLGAAGAVEAAYTALSIINQMVPPTINLVEPDPECDLDYVPNTPQKLEIRYALTNSFGFGGTNATLALKKYE